MRKITKKMVHECLSDIKRLPNGNKYDYGRVLICAGSYGMAGAAAMCGMGALRGGSGLVTFYAEPELIPILQSCVPEAMCTDINEDVILSKFNAIAIGPGLVSETGERRLKRFVKGFSNTLVIDAESLNVLAKSKQLDIIFERVENTILTPHEGEMSRLLGVDSAAVKEDRIGAARKLRDMTKADIVLKGHDTIVITKDGTEFINPTGNPGMATGGSGDVLTGLIAALAGQGMSSGEAAICGVYIHGKAGDICKKEYGEMSMTATDIASKIGSAIIDTGK